MGSFLKKFNNILGIEDVDYDESEYMEDGAAEDADYGFREDETLKASSRGRKRESGTNVVSLPSSGSMKMIVYHPMNYEDTQHIIDNLKSRKPVVVNMEHLVPESALRILDFMSGAIYALNGTMYKVSQGIFIVAPTNYDIIGDAAEDA